VLEWSHSQPASQFHIPHPAPIERLGDEDTRTYAESPYRANAVLYNLARGHAVICGRTVLSTDDLPLIAKVTLSSMPIERRCVLVAWAKKRDSLVVEDVAREARVSRHTAERIMQDIEALGIGTVRTQGTGRPTLLHLSPDWRWCIERDFCEFIRQGVTWQKSRGVSKDIKTHSD